MTLVKSGYERDVQGAWIAKDTQASLTYSMDWMDWLEEGDTIASVEYSLQVRANDPQPLLKASEGVQTGIFTFVRLTGGQEGKIYTVTAKVTTINGLIDRRSFRVKIENRSA